MVCSMFCGGVGLALLGCGGGDATSVALSVLEDAQQRDPDALTSGVSCEALLATFQRRLIEQVTARAAALRGGEPEADYAGEPSSVSASQDGDIAAVSGERVYLLHGSSLYVLGTSPELALASEVPLEGEPLQLFVAGARVLVLSRIIGPLPGADELYSPYAYYSPTYTKLTLLDAEGEPPVVLREVYVEGDAEAPIVARREQREVRALIQRASKSELDYPRLEYTDIYGQRRSLEALRPQIDAWEEISVESIQASTLTDYVPRRFERQGDELVEVPQRCPDYWLPGAGLTPAGFTTVVTLDLDSPGAPIGGFTLLGSVDAAYFQADSVILRRTDYGGPGAGEPGIDTVLHRFTLNGGEAAYSASGRIDGYISGAAALDERGGVLRAAVTQDLLEPPVEGGEPQYVGTSSRVLTMEAREGRLVELGRSAAFAAEHFITPTTIIGDRVYVTTTSNSPGQLLVIDVADPRAPALMGELSMNGYVELVVPLPGERLLGVGVAPDASGYPGDFALRLFDVADPGAPALVADYVYPTQAYSEARARGAALGVDAGGDHVAFPLRRYDTGVSSVEVFELTAGLERLGGVVLEPAARRGLFAGDVVLAFGAAGAESHALGALDGPALSHIPLPEMYVYP